MSAAAGATIHGWQHFARRLLALFGWHVRFDGLPGPKGVAIVYPHTSNWDFVIGLLAKWSIGLPIRWIGKETLFRGLTGATLGPADAAVGRPAGRPRTTRAAPSSNSRR